MLQIKLVQGKDIESLNKSANEFLADFNEEDIKDLTIDYDRMIALIQYEVKGMHENRKCYDCKYWDDGGSPSAVSGLCTECGQRRRFSCNACRLFKDIRG